MHVIMVLLFAELHIEASKVVPAMEQNRFLQWKQVYEMRYQLSEWPEYVLLQKLVSAETVCFDAKH